MTRIELESLSLVTFDKQNAEHLNFFKKLVTDDSIIRRFGGLLHMLNNSSNNESFFNCGYFVLAGNEYIGYIDIGRYIQDEEAIYLRSAIVKEQRNKGYGSRTLNETSNYIFENYPAVREIKLKTVTDNIEALKTIKSCGFKPIYGTLFSKRNPNYEREKIYNYHKNYVNL